MRQPAEVQPARELRAPERVQVRVDQARDERVAARVQDLGARVAVRAHVELVAGGDDRLPLIATAVQNGCAGSSVRTRALTIARSAAMVGFAAKRYARPATAIAVTTIGAAHTWYQGASSGASDVRGQATLTVSNASQATAATLTTIRARERDRTPWKRP